MPRHFQFGHGNFNLTTVTFTVAQKWHGNFNLITEISILSRQLQFGYGNFNLTTATFTVAHNYHIPTALTTVKITAHVCGIHIIGEHLAIFLLHYFDSTKVSYYYFFFLSTITAHQGAVYAITKVTLDCFKIIDLA